MRLVTKLVEINPILRHFIIEGYKPSTERQRFEFQAAKNYARRSAYDAAAMKQYEQIEAMK